MKRFIFLALLLFCQRTLFSQKVDVAVSHLNSNKASLSALSGEKTAQIDSISSTSHGRFQFSLNRKDLHQGVYRISFEKGRWIDFINSGEDVTITTDANSIQESVKVVSSETNKLYYSFLKLNREYKTKSDLLQLVLARYPKDDPYYATSRTRLTDLQKEYSVFVGITSQRDPKSFVARYIRSSQLPFPDFDQSPENQLSYLKAHALDNVDFRDDGLIYSDLFTNKSIEYLTYYRNPQLPKELLEKEFMVAVDTILGKARVNLIVYQHIMEYLVDGFRKFGFEKCIDYILENYVIKDDLCLNDAPGSSLNRMIEQKKLLPVGITAPGILLPDTCGIPASLESINADKTLLLFYSTSCPHCQAIIPRLAEIYEARKSFQVIAVSLDTSRAEWIRFVGANKLPWINVADPKGWSGNVASDYYIYATPTMVLLDKDKKILAKPLTIEDLLKLL